MICYASQTGTKRNLAAMRAAGWRILLSRGARSRTKGFRYALDNGAWSDFLNGTAFDEDAFEKLLERFGAGADWVVLPDIVAGGIASLDLSRRWLNRCLASCPLVLIAVQDGMTPDDLRPFVGKTVGIFLGGSTEWKLANMILWGKFCAEAGCHYHVARVNTAKRMALAAAGGADSVDGSSASRYAVTLPLIERARQQHDLFSPREFMA